MSLTKVIIILMDSVKLGLYLLCGGVAACLGVSCVLCAVHSTAHSTHVAFLCAATNAIFATSASYQMFLFFCHLLCNGRVIPCNVLGL